MSRNGPTTQPLAIPSAGAPAGASMGGLDQLPVFGSSPTAATGSGGLLSSEVDRPSLSQVDRPSTVSTGSTAVASSASTQAGRRRILLAFDCTPDAELAFTYAIDHLAAGDIVFLTNVLPPGALDTDGHRFISPSSPSKNSGLKSKDLSGDILETLKSKSDLLTERGIECRIVCHVTEEDAKSALVSIATHYRVDLVILGHRKLSKFQKIISTGSVAAYVVAHAKQSVLVIKK